MDADDKLTKGVTWGRARDEGATVEKKERQWKSEGSSLCCLQPSFLSLLCELASTGSCMPDQRNAVHHLT